MKLHSMMDGSTEISRSSLDPGVHGGQIVAQGRQEAIMQAPESVTGRYISGAASIVAPKKRYTLEVFVCVTGVSGSGKSSLINEILYKQLWIDKTGARIEPGIHDFLFGAEMLSAATRRSTSA